MNPSDIGVRPSVVPRGIPSGSPSVETGRKSQVVLEPSPPYEKQTEFHMLPSWSEKIHAGMRATGFGAGSVFFGALAIGLLPFTIAGGLLFLGGASLALSVNVMQEMALQQGVELSEKDMEPDMKQKVGKALILIGSVLAAPIFGVCHCLEEVEEPAHRLRAFEASVKESIKYLSSGNFGRTEELRELRRKEVLERFKMNIQAYSKNDLLKLHKYITNLSTVERSDEKVTEEKKHDFRVILENHLEERYGGR
jgi:hypothetical protein